MHLSSLPFRAAARALCGMAVAGSMGAFALTAAQAGEAAQNAPRCKDVNGSIVAVQTTRDDSLSFAFDPQTPDQGNLQVETKDKLRIVLVGKDGPIGPDTVTDKTSFEMKFDERPKRDQSYIERARKLAQTCLAQRAKNAPTR